MEYMDEWPVDNIFEAAENGFNRQVLRFIREGQDVNASGLLKWNKNDGSVNGNGKDNKGKKIKFKVGPAN